MVVGTVDVRKLRCINIASNSIIFIPSFTKSFLLVQRLCRLGTVWNSHVVILYSM